MLSREEKIKIASQQLTPDEFKEYKEAMYMDELGFEDERGQWVCTGYVTDKWDKKLFKTPIVKVKDKGAFNEAIIKVCKQIIESNTSDKSLKNNARNILEKFDKSYIYY